ncbi:hypothetical protein GP486_004887 [Trichoglossum hirsutum]|uniref:Kinesin light chain n=1 Tax=Trichoglossum hirsutum TaxID=265104 RepID=A0A9P8LA91_9PEZI|nr:hypothetical protein GP486_004887 [Trichoglossum hirsutum]
MLVSKHRDGIHPTSQLPTTGWQSTGKLIDAPHKPSKHGVTNGRTLKSLLKSRIDDLDRQKAAIGREHPETLQTAYSVANILSEQGRHKDALKWYLEIYGTSKRSLGDQRRVTLQTVKSIGDIYDIANVSAQQERPKNALKWYLEIYDISVKVLSGQHWVTLQTMRSIADTSGKLGWHEEAKEWRRNGD